MFQRIRKWGFIKRGLLFGHIDAKIDNPEISIPACYVKPVKPWLYNIAVGLAVRVR